MKLIKGENLNGEQRALVLRAFLYRWTHENEQRTRVYKCALCDIRKPYENSVSSNGHTHPTVPLIHDAQWITEHAFWFSNDGARLGGSGRHQHAEPVYMADDKEYSRD